MSNRYIFIYATVLVTVVAAILSAAAMLLKPYQQRNITIEKMQNILMAAGHDEVNYDNAESLFKNHCHSLYAIDADGHIVDAADAEDPTQSKAFNIDLKESLYCRAEGRPFLLPLFLIENQGHMITVIPLQGNGLWGPIWGYLALEEDLNTIAGVVFDHKSETPGLGAEITSTAFQTQFIGKTLFDNGQFRPLRVKKGGIATLPLKEHCHAVDAISGGTITSNGVEMMLSEVLNAYLPYLQSKHHDNKR